MTLRAVEALADKALDASLLGYTRLGYGVRRRSSSWPQLPSDALAGRRVIVTGATSGIGEAAAVQIALLGGHVDLVARNPDKGAASAARVEAAVGRAAATVWECDLARFSSIDAFVTAYRAAGHRPAGLVHNAGVLPAQRTESEQGHELTMAVHVLGPTRMTDALADRLAPGGRVVFVTSGGMYTQALPVDDPEYLEGDYRGATAYARSKRTQVDLLERFARRWPDVWVGAMHPGWVDSPGLTESLPTFAKVAGPLLRAPDSGADTIGWLLASDPAPSDGLFWHDRRARPTHRLPSTRVSESDRERMWQWVVENAGVAAG